MRGSEDRGVLVGLRITKHGDVIDTLYRKKRGKVTVTGLNLDVTERGTKNLTGGRTKGSEEGR